METISFKAPAGTKRKLLRLARRRGETSSYVARQAVQRALEEDCGGALLGAGRKFMAGPSSHDPGAPALAPQDWEMNS
jgi:predicted transcriptional regulator